MFKAITMATVATAAAGLFWGGIGVWLMVVLTISLGTVWLIHRYGYVRVPEMQVAVLYNTGSQTFARFLPPGKHWIMPFVEHVESMISTAPETTQGKSTGIQASGGLTLSVEWSVAYNLNPLKVTADTRAKAARTLPAKAALVAKKHMSNCLQHIIGEYTVEQLCQPGIHKRLEREVRQLLAERLASLGFEISRVMIGVLELPAHVTSALEAAQERQLQAEHEARALAHLQKVISQFSDADMQRLMELERIHVLGQNGVALLYPAGLERTGSTFKLDDFGLQIRRPSQS